MALSRNAPAQHITVRLTDKTCHAVDELAARRGLRRSDIIREAVLCFVDPAELARHVAEVMVLAETPETVS